MVWSISSTVRIPLLRGLRRLILICLSTSFIAQSTVLRADEPPGQTLRDRLLAGVTKDRPAQAYFLDRALYLLSEGVAHDDAAARDALDLLNKGQTADAMSRLESAARTRVPTDAAGAAQSWWIAGVIAESVDRGRSTIDFEHAVQLAPDDSAARYGLAAQQAEADNAVNAIANFRHVVEATRNEPELFYQYWAQLNLVDLRVLARDRDGVAETLRALQSKVEALVAQDPDALAWERDLAMSMHIFGGSQRSHGSPTDALATHRAALAISVKLAAADPLDRNRQRDLAVGEELVGEVLIATGHAAEAQPFERDAITIFRANVAANPRDVIARKDEAWCGETLADLLIANGGDDAEARALLESSIAVATWVGRVVKETDGQWHRDVARREMKLADMLETRTGDLAGAVYWYDALRSLDAWLVRSDPSDRQRRRDLAVAFHKLGDAQFRNGKPKEGADALTQAMRIDQRLVAENPADLEAQIEVAALADKAGIAGHEAHHDDDAIIAFKAELEARRIIAKALHGNADARHAMALTLESLADAQEASGDLDGALRSYQEAATFYEALRQSQPHSAELMRDLGVAYNNIGCVQLKLDDIPTAITNFQRRHALFDAVALAQPDDRERQAELVISYMQLQDWLVKAGRTADATALVKAGRNRLAEISKRHPDMATHMSWFDEKLEMASAPAGAHTAK